jgi:hypothetical protein
MKTFYFMLLGFMLFAVQANACEIKLTVVQGKKDVYKAGDTITVDVRVTLLHRNCHVDIKSTKLTGEGLEIKSATSWKQNGDGSYVRRVRIVFTNDNKKNAKLVVSRECNKEGGYASLTFKKA